MFPHAVALCLAPARLACVCQTLEPSAIDASELQLTVPDSRLDCRDYLASVVKDGRAWGGCPESGTGVMCLLDVLDTSDKDKFQKTVDSLLEIGAFNPQHEPLKLPGVDKHGFGSMSIEHMISAAFKPKT